MIALGRGPCDEPAIAHAVSAAPVPCPADVGRSVLVATILASSMVFIDSSAVNVALPTLQRDFAATAAQAQWVVESYALFLAALLLLGGALGDRSGRKRIFLIGTALFTAASVACGLAPTMPALIGARAVQGIGAALLTPASLAIISATFLDPAERGRAIGTWSGSTALTSAAGPILGGWLVEHVSWRGVFFINLPLAVVVALVAWRGVPESRDETAAPLDRLGAVLATIGLGGVVFGLIEGPIRGWSDRLVVAGIGVGLVAAVAFVIVETRVSAPMLPLALFRAPTFAGANLATLLLYGAFGGLLFWLPFNLIQVQGYTPTAAGAALAPTVLIVFGLSRWTGGLIGSVGAKLPLIVGPALVAAAFVLFALPGVGGAYWTTFFPPAVVLGLGLAITVPPLTTAALGAVAPQRAGLASGINNAVARTAGLLAIAGFGVIVTTVFGGQLEQRLDAMPNLSQTTRSAILMHSAELAAALPPTDADPATAADVAAAIDAAFVAGFRAACLLAATLALLASLTAWRMVAGKEPAGGMANVQGSDRRSAR